MAKRKMTLRVRLPEYRTPRNMWRRDIHAAVIAALPAQGVRYIDGDRLEVRIRLYMKEAPLEIHDVDNRLKDILDALQGRAGGSKSRRSLTAVIPNDWQVFRVVIEKAAPPGQSHGRGHLVIRKLRP